MWRLGRHAPDPGHYRLPRHTNLPARPCSLGQQRVPTRIDNHLHPPLFLFLQDHLPFDHLTIFDTLGPGDRSSANGPASRTSGGRGTIGHRRALRDEVFDSGLEVFSASFDIFPEVKAPEVIFGDGMAHGG